MDAHLVHAAGEGPALNEGVATKLFTDFKRGARAFAFLLVHANHPRPTGKRTERGIDFQTLVAAERKRAIGELGGHLMAAVGRVVPVLPVPLVAAVILAREQVGISELELKAEVNTLIERLEAAGAHTYIPRKDLDYAVGVGLRMLTLRHLVEETDGLYRAQPIELPVLRYYANSIAHFLPKTAGDAAGTLAAA